jgi:hypothetical protein
MTPKFRRSWLNSSTTGLSTKPTTGTRPFRTPLCSRFPPKRRQIKQGCEKNNGTSALTFNIWKSEQGDRRCFFIFKKYLDRVYGWTQYFPSIKKIQNLPNQLQTEDVSIVD